MECSICKFPLSVSPFGDNSIQDSSAKITICGHLFHSVCWLKAAEYSASRDLKCAFCRTPNIADGDVRDVFIGDGNVRDVYIGNEHEQLAQSVADLTAANEQLVQEVESLKLKLASVKKNPISEEPGRPRWHMGIMEDATCYNCESNEHQTQACEFGVIIRNVDYTARDKWGQATKYDYALQIDSEEAGEIVTYFEKKINMKFSRKEVQCVYALMFFEKICWGCASPFHFHLECGKPLDPSIKKVCKLIHLENHPLSDAEVRKRHQRYLNYRKR